MKTGLEEIRRAAVSGDMSSRFLKFVLLPVIGLSFVAGARPANAQAAAPLTAEGKKHLERYAAMLEAVKGQVTAALPAIDPGLQAALDQAHEAVIRETQTAAEAEKNLGTINNARGLVGHAKNKWIREADQGIAKAEAALKNAKSGADRDAARKDLARWQQNRAEGVKALEERQAALDAAMKNEEKFKREHEAAQAALAKAREAESTASKNLLEALSPVLASGSLDAALVKGAVLSSATPEGLARFAQSDAGNAALIDMLLNTRAGKEADDAA